MDKDGDGQVSPEEFEAAGFKGLPSSDDIGAEGHHYDVESGASFWNRVDPAYGNAYHPTCNRVFPPSRRYVSPRGYPSTQLTLTSSILEQFHSTPETQMDESYNHPEDIDIFPTTKPLKF